MSTTYLAIDKNASVHEKESRWWRAHGISDVRVDSMTEGIEKAMSCQFLFIAINADNIVNYMPILHILNDVTDDPIIIGSSTFTIEEQAEAINSGAVFYGKFGDSDENMRVAQAVMNRVNERDGHKKRVIKGVIAHNDFLIVEDHQLAFIKDVEIHLTRIETRILRYFLINQGVVVTYSQIHKQAWPRDAVLSHENIYSTLKRLRNKIRAITGDEYISTVRDVGYRLSTKPTIFK